MASREPVYLLRQPKSLESLARKGVTDWIISKAKQLLSLELHLLDPYDASRLITMNTTLFRYYLLIHLPGPINAMIASETKLALQELWKVSCTHKDFALKFQPGSPTNVIGRMIEAVYTTNLTYLSVKSLSICQYLKMFLATLGAQAHLISNLSKLCINTLSPMKDTEITSILRELNHLKQLSLKNCTHNVVRCIADHCKLIENLEIWHLWYNKHINIKSIQILAQLPKLKSISLIQTSLNETGMERLFLSADTDVEILVTMSSHNNNLECTIERCLEHIDSQEGNEGRPIGLTYYEDCSKTTLELLQLVVGMCPWIKKISLEKHETEENYLKVIYDLPELIELELTNFEFFTDQVNELLSAKGLALTHLHLRSIQQMDMNALVWVFKSCRNLESLYINNCCFLEESTPYERPLFGTWKLYKLKTLALIQTQKLHEDLRLNSDQLFYILTGSPCVEHVHTVGIPLQDYFMDNVLDMNKFKYLKQWKLFYKDQPIVETDWVAQSCDNWVNHPEVVFSHVYSENELLLINRSYIDK